MSGVELRDGTLVVEREPNDLDELAIEFSTILDRLDIDHAYVAGYVSILVGRARSTEDVDVLVEPLDRSTVNCLVDTLEDEGYWGPAMPLSSAYEMLSNGDTVWVAPQDQIAPHLDVQFPDDEFDYASLENAMTARVGTATVPVGPLELQIAYKLYLGSKTDVEDAVHLYSVFEESLSVDRLEDWVRKLDVREEYDRLRHS